MSEQTKLDPAIRERLDRLQEEIYSRPTWDRRKSLQDEFDKIIWQHWPAISAALAEREGK